MKLWVRFGDRDDYQDFDDLKSALVAIQANVRGPLWGWVNGRAIGGSGIAGFTAPNFEGYNYVSIYWGNDKAESIRGLSKRERARIERAVNDNPER